MIGAIAISAILISCSSTPEVVNHALRICSSDYREKTDIAFELPPGRVSLSIKTIIDPRNIEAGTYDQVVHCRLTAIERLSDIPIVSEARLTTTHKASSFLKGSHYIEVDNTWMEQADCGERKSIDIEVLPLANTHIDGVVLTYMDTSGKSEFTDIIDETPGGYRITGVVESDAGCHPDDRRSHGLLIVSTKHSEILVY